MAEYIIREQAKQAIYEYILQQTVSKYPSEELCKASRMGAEGAMYEIDYVPAADVVEVVRCKDCKRCYEKRTKRNNQLMRFCMRMDGNEYQVNANDFCSYGTPKERGADNPKITCLNCKHLMYSDMYGECNKQLKIVNPSDTCEYAEPKERGGEK